MMAKWTNYLKERRIAGGGAQGVRGLHVDRVRPASPKGRFRTWRRWRRLRQIVQILALLVFVVSLIGSWRAGEGPSTTGLFFRLNPLAALAAMIAGRAWIPGMAWALVTLAVTLLLGRVWCGWLCPFGTVLEWVRFPVWSPQS